MHDLFILTMFNKETEVKKIEVNNSSPVVRLLIAFSEFLENIWVSFYCLVYFIRKASDFILI